MSSTKTVLYNEYTVSELTWTNEYGTGVYKTSISSFSGSDYNHPALDNIELIKYNYTKNSVLSNMSVNAFFVLNGNLYINFGNDVNPNNLTSKLQMGKTADQSITLTNELNKLEIYSTTNNQIVVKDSNGSTIIPTGTSRPPYYNVWIININDLPSSTITIQNCGVSTATVSYDDGTGSSSVTDVTLNGSSIVVDGIAELTDTNLGLKQFITSVTELIPENELTINELYNTYLLTSYQDGYTVGDFYTVIEDPDNVGNYIYKNVGKTSIPVGSVYDIKFICQLDEGDTNTLKLNWKDPDDLVVNGVVISKWQKTVVRYNSYDKNYVGEMTYPANPNDGVELLTNSIKNKYAVNTFTYKQMPKDSIYFIRFFPCNMNNVYTIDTVNPNDNRICTTDFTWSMLNSYLEDFETDISSAVYPHDISSKILPDEGGEVNINYLINDFYTTSNNQRVNVYHRYDEDENGGIITNVKNGNLKPVDTDWKVLGYNKTVPRYIKYRRTNENNEYEYIFVSSVDDSAIVMHFKDFGESKFSDKEIITGTLLKREIGIGSRVYERTYDERETEWTYTAISGQTISDVSQESFIYGSDKYSYSVPRTITVNNNTYDFHGYTMTLQPKFCLRTNGYSGNQTTMQWKTGTEPIVNAISEVFDSNQKYYKAETDISTYKFVEISGTTTELIQNRDYDVYTIDSDNRLKLMTEYYKPGVLPYSLNNNTKPTGNINGHLYSKTVNESGTETTTALNVCYKWEPNRVYVSNANPLIYVFYNDKIYRVRSNTSLTDITPPDQDGTHYYNDPNGDNPPVDVSNQTPEEAGFCIYGTRIPIPSVEMTIKERTPDTNCSLYELSWYRFWINDKYGYSDRNISWKKQNIFDRQSTTNMASSNGLRSRLLAEPDLLKQIIPVINPTYIKNTWGPYSNYEFVGVTSSQSWIQNNYFLYYPTDYFFPLGGQDAAFGWEDGTGVFSAVYTNDDSRKKNYMNLDGTGTEPGSGNGVNWWLRTPYDYNANRENVVSSSGSYNSYYYVTNSLGVCPACAIG